MKKIVGEVKKKLSLLLAVAMLIGSLPVSTLTATAAAPNTEAVLEESALVEEETTTLVEEETTLVEEETTLVEEETTPVEEETTPAEEETVIETEEETLEANQTVSENGYTITSTGEGASAVISDGPQIAGYTQIKSLDELAESKSYLVVAVHQDYTAGGEVYAFYGNSLGLEMKPGALEKVEDSTGRLTVKLENYDPATQEDNPIQGSYLFERETFNSQAIQDKVELRLVKAGSDYVLRTAEGYYVDLVDNMLSYEKEALQITVGEGNQDFDIKRLVPENANVVSRLLTLNIRGQVGMASNHTDYNTDFWAPLDNNESYNYGAYKTYLYARTDYTLTDTEVRQDKRGLEAEVKNAPKFTPEQEEDYTPYSLDVYKEALAAAEEALNNPEINQDDLDAIRLRLVKAIAGLTLIPTYEKPVFYEYQLVTNGIIEENAVYIIATTTSETEPKILYSNGKEKTDRLSATVANNILTPTLGNFSETTVTWKVEKAGDDDTYYLKSEYGSGRLYLNLNRASGTNVEVGLIGEKLRFESAADNAFMIKGADNSTNLGLNYSANNKFYVSASSTTTFKLFKRVEIPSQDTDIVPNAPITGTTVGQPFISNQPAGNTAFRIPALITAADGSLVAAADARWVGAEDYGNNDTIVSKSKDNGKTWTYSLPIYFNDATNTQQPYSTTAIDPVMIKDNNGKLYLMVDLFPGGVAIPSDAPYKAAAATGYATIRGVDRLVLYYSPNPAEQTDTNYAYYVGDYTKKLVGSEDKEVAPVLDAKVHTESGFYVDRNFYLYTTNEQDSIEPMYCVQLGNNKAMVHQNIFYENALLHVRATTYIYMVTSVDNGDTWSDPVLLNSQIRNKNNPENYYIVAPGTGICLTDGTLIVPCYSAYSNEDTQINSASQRSSFIYSSDGGVTWKRSQDATTEFWSSESCVVQLDRNTVRQFFRGSESSLQYTDHTRQSNGAWKAGQPQVMQEVVRTSNNQLSAIRYSKLYDGKPIILVSTATASGGNRRNGKVYLLALNNDNTMKLVGAHAVNTGQYLYSSLTEMKTAPGNGTENEDTSTYSPAGSIGLLYETSWSSISFTTITIDNLMASPGSGNDQLQFTEMTGVPLYDNIWAAGLEDLQYTGGKLTQEIRVYDNGQPLVEGVDYTVSYKNNTNAYEWDAKDYEEYVKLLASNPKTKGYGTFTAAKAPQVILKMKGNYSGSKAIYFQIERQDIDEDTVRVDDLSATYTGKKQTPLPVVTWNGKTLKNNKDFTVKEYGDKKADKSAYTQSNEYELTLIGKGNYTGQRIITYTISKGVQEVSMSKVTVKGIKPQVWTKELIETGGMMPTFTVTNKKDMLVEDKYSDGRGDFTVRYENNTAVGTAYLILEGTGDDHDGDGISYIGTKRVAFKITGTAMSKVTVVGVNKTYPYTGSPIEPTELTDTDGKPRVRLSYQPKNALGQDLEEDTHYSVSYQKNTNKGTATILFTGNPEYGYTGTKKVTFKITSAGIIAGGENAPFTVKLVHDDLVGDGNTDPYQLPYMKGGATPGVVVTNNESGEEMILGKDYTVSYKNNKAVAQYNAAKAPTVVVKGKGNYAGTVEVKFTIIKKNIETYDDVYIVANDKEVNTKKNGWKQSFKVYDADGKALNAKDYNVKEATYTIDSSSEPSLNGTVPSEATLVPAGSEISITVKLFGDNYEGEVTGTYRILEVGKDISKATLQIKDQEYTGSPIEITSNSQFKKASLKNGIQLYLVDDGDGKEQNIEIDEASYQKNINKGTAKVTIRGYGEYGGSKTVTYKIGQRSVVNWFNNLFDDWTWIFF